jgi:hypothetical protein
VRPSLRVISPVQGIWKLREGLLPSNAEVILKSNLGYASLRDKGAVFLYLVCTSVRRLWRFLAFWRNIESINYDVSSYGESPNPALSAIRISLVTS